MDSRIFDRYQRKGNFLHLFGLSLTSLGFLGISFIIFITINGINILAERDEIGILSIFALFFAVGFVFFWIMVGGIRKKVRESYEQLSDTEKAEINTELSGKYKQLPFGANRLYFYWGSFLFFIEYDDIAWVFQSNTVMPLVADIGGAAVDSSYNLPSLIIYNRSGKRYKIPVKTKPWPTIMDIETIKEKSPDAIFGYSKERLKLAKRDFERFLIEENEKH